VRVRGSRLLLLTALPVLAVSVSIGAVVPSAPFDAWSPPPVSVQHGARPVKKPSSAPGERGVPLAALVRPGRHDDPPRRATGRPARATLPASLVALAALVTRLARPAAAGVDGTPIARRAAVVPGWALSWWRGAASGPLRAPPHLPTT
jgi:hypothetical protein